MVEILMERKRNSRETVFDSLRPRSKELACLGVETEGLPQQVDELTPRRQDCACGAGLQRSHGTHPQAPGGNTSMTTSASSVSENECLNSRCSLSYYLECASVLRTCWTLETKFVW